MKKRIILLSLVSVFLLSIMFGKLAVAQERIVGVEVGDSFKYSCIFDWSSDDPEFPYPDFGTLWELWGILNDFCNEVGWVEIIVENVSATNIVFQTVNHWKNGTEETSYYSLDILTGPEPEGEQLMLFRAISANLDANDALYPSDRFSHLKINETVDRTYPGRIRKTNHMNVTGEGLVEEYNFYVCSNYYWDRSTGILVEMSIEWIIQRNEYLTTGSFEFGIIASNVWVIPEFPTWTSMLLILIVLTVAIATYKRRLPKTPIH